MQDLRRSRLRGADQGPHRRHSGGNLVAAWIDARTSPARVRVARKPAAGAWSASIEISPAPASSAPSRELKQNSDNIVYGLGPLYVVKSDATTLTLARDGSKNVRAEVNSSGAVTGAFRYRAYGQLAQVTATSPSYLGLASQMLDPSGLYYMRARWYDPVTGRLLARDPVNGDAAMPWTLNSVVYAGANPNRFSDPSGAFCIPCLALIPIAWQVIQVALTASDVVATAETLSDPEASAADKALSVGLAAAGLIDPVGGGYATGARAARGVAKSQKIVVIGEDMNRVKKYANEVGGEYYVPGPKKPTRAETSGRTSSGFIRSCLMKTLWSTTLALRGPSR